MQNILGKRVLRDLRAHFLRWSALFGLIVMGTYMIVSLLGAAEIVIREARAHAKDNQVEDGQFTTFLPLKASEEAELTDAGITLERTFHVDFPAEDGGTLRVMKVRRTIDLIECDEGVYPEADGEAVIEKRYAEVHGLHVGDAVRAGRWEFVISGIGTVPDYESPIAKMSDSIVDSQSFGLLFVTDERYDAMRTSGESLEAESCVYAYRLNNAMTDRELKEKIEGFPFDYRDVSDPDFRAYISERMGPAEDIRDLLENPFFSQDEEARDLIKMLDPDVRILTQFIPKNENMRIDTAAADVEINKSTCIFAGIIVFALFAYVIAVFVIHEIEEESEVIGALYALGVTGRDLMRHYTLLPVLVSFLAGIAGTILGMSPAGVGYQLMDTYGYFSVPDLGIHVYAYILIYGLLVPPLISAIVNRFVIRKRLTKPVLELLRKVKKENGKHRQVDLGRFSFVTQFRIRQMLREMRSALTVVAGLFICLLLLFIAVDCYVMCNHVKSDYVRDTHYEYMYTLKYPEKEVPEGGEEAFAVSLSKESFGYTFDVTVLGVHEDNPYFDLALKKSRKDVVISSAMAQKFGIGIGDEVVLEDREDEQLYAFNASEITQYSPGFFIFMDIDVMREMFGEDEEYYNVVFSDKALSIPAGRVFSALSRETVKRSSGVFTAMMLSMVYVMGGLATIIFVVVMYLMLSVMVENSSYDIALMKIFGYTRGEIRKLYVNGNFYIVAVGTLIVLPLAKVIIDGLYPYFISNVSCAMDLSMPFAVYLVMYGVIIGLYLVITFFLNRKLDRVSMEQVLKNRE